MAGCEYLVFLCFEVTLRRYQIYYEDFARSYHVFSWRPIHLL